MAQRKNEGRNLDVYLLAVIVLLVATLGGGLWIIGKGIDVRLDELSLRFTSQTGQIRGELFNLRKTVDQLSRQARQQHAMLDKLTFKLIPPQKEDTIVKLKR